MILLNRQMHLALIISFLWHLVGFFSISIIFAPSGVKAHSFSSIHFLGEILGNPVLASEPLKTQNKDALISAEEAASKINVEGAAPLLSPIEREISHLDEFIDVDRPKESRPFVAASVSAEAGPKREVIFQPPLPRYPEWAQQELRKDSIIFGVYISANGLVEQLINLESSGNPEIDVALARYIRRWRFAPSLEQDGQWQTLTLDLAND